MKLIAMINTKKLLVTAFASYSDYHHIIYIYDGITVNLAIDRASEICEDIEGNLCQMEALEVAIRNEESKEVKAETSRVMDAVSADYWSKKFAHPAR